MFENLLKIIIIIKLLTTVACINNQTEDKAVKQEAPKDTLTN